MPFGLLTEDGFPLSRPRPGAISPFGPFALSRFLARVQDSSNLTAEVMPERRLPCSGFSFGREDTASPALIFPFPRALTSYGGGKQNCLGGWEDR